MREAVEEGKDIQDILFDHNLGFDYTIILFE
jgi:hypothetical protein